MSKKLAERCDRFIRRCNAIHRLDTTATTFIERDSETQRAVRILFDSNDRLLHSESIAASWISSTIANVSQKFGVLARRELILCSIAHAFFESRLDNRAINHKSKAVGIFQFTPSGLGNKKLGGGMRIPHYEEDFVSYQNNFDMRDGYDATDNRETTTVFAQVFRSLHDKKYCHRSFHDESIMNKYSMMYWSPLCGGYVKKANLLDSVHMQKMKHNGQVMYLTDALGYIFPDSLVFKTDGGNVKLFV